MSKAQGKTVEGASRPPSLAVVERVADCENVHPTELTPLHGTIDPDALDRLVETQRRNDRTLQINFTYHGYDVGVDGDGMIHLTGDAGIEK